MSISRADVEHIALLSRLYLRDDEIDKYSNELTSILAYVEKIQELDTSDILPMAHAVEQCNVFRTDDVEPSLDIDDTLANAAEKDPPFFKVPRIVD